MRGNPGWHRDAGELNPCRQVCRKPKGVRCSGIILARGGNSGHHHQLLVCLLLMVVIMAAVSATEEYILRTRQGSSNIPVLRIRTPYAGTPAGVRMGRLLTANHATAHANLSRRRDRVRVFNALAPFSAPKCVLTSEPLTPLVSTEATRRHTKHSGARG
jgi:hypothetical protein